MPKTITLQLSMLFCMSVSACALPINVVRVAEPLKLTISEPANSCEQRGWYDIVPVRAFAGTSQVTSMAPTVTAAAAVPRAVYRQGRSEPEDLIDLLPRMDEPEVDQAHTLRFKPIQAKISRTTTAIAIGAGLAVVGLGLMIAGAADTSGNGHPNMGLVGAGGAVTGVGLIADLIAVALAPTAEEQLFLASRRVLFFPDEDEMPFVERGISRLNQRTRSACQSSSEPR